MSRGGGLSPRGDGEERRDRPMGGASKRSAEGHRHWDWTWEDGCGWKEQLESGVTKPGTQSAF